MDYGTKDTICKKIWTLFECLDSGFYFLNCDSTTLCGTCWCKCCCCGRLQFFKVMFHLINSTSLLQNRSLISSPPHLSLLWENELNVMGTQVVVVVSLCHFTDILFINDSFKQRMWSCKGLQKWVEKEEATVAACLVVAASLKTWQNWDVGSGWYWPSHATDTFPPCHRIHM